MTRAQERDIKEREIKEASERAKAEGMVMGMAEGEKQKSIEIAKNLLSLNLDIDSISKATGLSIQEINDINHKSQIL